MEWRWTRTTGRVDSVDVVVVGGGPAGIAAAGAAGESGRKVLLIERRTRLGGNVWFPVAGEAPAPEVATALRRLERPNVDVLTGSEVLDRPHGSTLLVATGGAVREVTYRQMILATGARERFLPFPGWTLPNVTGAGGLQLLVKAGLSVKGRSIVLAGTGPLLLAAGGYLREQGADVRLVAEQSAAWRVWRLAAGLLGDRDRLRQAIELRRQLAGVAYRKGCWVVRAEGHRKLERVVLRQGRREWTEEVDFLGCGFHLVPNTDIAELLGCTMEAGFVRVDEYQMTSIPGIYAAGEPVGIGGLELSRLEGEIAGLAGTDQRSTAANLFAQRHKSSRFRGALRRAFPLDARLRGVVTPTTIVCRCEDVRAEAVRPFQNGRDARLQSRCGMGRCQGRVCGPAAEFLWGWTPRGVRPPLVPATVGQLVLRTPPGSSPDPRP